LDSSVVVRVTNVFVGSVVVTFEIFCQENATIGAEQVAKNLIEKWSKGEFKYNDKPVQSLADITFAGN
jgi:hypothetical protein